MSEKTDARTEGFLQMKAEVDRLGDMINSSMEMLGQYAKNTDSESASYIAHQLVSHDSRRAAEIFYGMVAELKLVGDLEEFTVGANREFIIHLHNVTEAQSVLNRSYCRVDPKLVAKWVERNGSPIESTSYNVYAQIEYNNSVMVPKVTMHRGINPVLDEIIRCTVPIYERSCIFDGEWDPGFLEYTIAKNAVPLKAALDSLPSNPPVQLKALLMDAIETNWNYSIQTKSSSAMSDLVGALLKHFGDQPEVKTYVGGLLAECQIAKVVVPRVAFVESNLFSPNSIIVNVAKEYGQMAQCIHQRIAQERPAWLKSASKPAIESVVSKTGGKQTSKPLNCRLV